jgi:hypothetical protein
MVGFSADIRGEIERREKGAGTVFAGITLFAEAGKIFSPICVWGGYAGIRPRRKSVLLYIFFRRRVQTRRSRDTAAAFAAKHL